MDTKLIDIFVSCSRADGAQVEPWMRRLREGGVVVWYDATRDTGRRKMTAREAAEHCELLVWFVSRLSGASQEAGAAAAAASEKGKAVLIVALDASPLPKVFDLSLPRISVVDLLGVGREATWEALLKTVREQGVPWIPPGRSRRRSTAPNRRRTKAATKAWAAAAMVSALILLGAFLAWPYITRPRPGPPEVPVAVAVPFPVLAPKETAPAPSEPQVPHAVPVPSPVSPPVAQAPPAIPVERSPGTEDALAKRAIEFVTSCIGAPGRENGLTQEQVDAAAAYFADPTLIRGLGQQPVSAIKASIHNRQNEWPKWKEVIHYINAQPASDPQCREVTALISYSGESPEKGVAQGVVRGHYVVSFSDPRDPHIIELWTDDQKPQ